MAATRGDGGRGASGLTGSPRAVTFLLLLGGLALVNRYAPGILQATLVIVVLYLVVTHGDQVSQAINRGSGDLARAFRVI